MTMQVADVSKALGSVYRMNQAGHRVVLDGDDSYFVHKGSGKKMKIDIEDGQYVFYMWVKGKDQKEQEAQNRYACLLEDDDRDFSWQDKI